MYYSVTIRDLFKPLLGAFLLVLSSQLSFGQTIAPRDHQTNKDQTAAEQLRLERDKAAQQLEQLSKQAEISAERQKILRDSIAKLGFDNEALSTALLESATLEKELSAKIEANQERLETLKIEEDLLKGSLIARRSVLAEVLAALQRMGINPPPAILIRPDDALSSVRSAILLGAVVPDMKKQTDRLLADLNRLVEIRQASVNEQEKLAENRTNQAEEQERLKLLIAEKSKQRLRSAETLEEEIASEQTAKQRADEMLSLLEELNTELADIDARIDQRRAALEAKSRAEEKRLALGRERAERVDPNTQKLGVRRQFAKLRGLMDAPVIGERTRRFGSRTSEGKRAKGDTITTNSSAIVSIPADGVVRFAGPFRSFGNVLIIDLGDNYRLVLAGMSILAVEKGQTVLAGEPVALMGETRVASAVSTGFNVNNTLTTMESTRPELYIELRKDGQSINPSAWWKSGKTGRLGNDS